MNTNVLASYTQTPEEYLNSLASPDIPFCVFEAESSLHSEALSFDLDSMRNESPFSLALDLALIDKCKKQDQSSESILGSSTDGHDDTGSDKERENDSSKTSEGTGDSPLENSCLLSDISCDLIIPNKDCSKQPTPVKESLPRKDVMIKSMLRGVKRFFD